MSSGAARPVSVLLALALSGGGAVALSAPAFAVPTGGFLVYGLTATDAITTFRTDTPGTRTTPVPVTGLAAGDDVVGIDVRPATGELYGIVKGATADKVITIDPATGAATVKGLPISPRLLGTAFGVDFNPVPDRIRVVSDLEQNLRLNPVTGGASAVTAPSTTGDGNLAYAAGDPGAGTDPSVVAAGYTNSFAGTTATTLFDIDSARDVLVSQSPPNNGTLNTIGALNVDTSSLAGFDIAATPGGGNAAYAVLTVAGVAGLYAVDTTTGAATLVGAAGDVEDITVAVPRVTVTTAGFTEGGTGTITVTRTGDTSAAATVDYATAPGTGAAGSDYTAVAGTLSFAAGEGSKTISVALPQDTAVEGAETFRLTLTTTAPDLVVPASTTVTVADDESGLAYALTSANEVVTFSVKAPGTAISTRAITGLAAGDDVVGIDVRPATGELYGIVKGTDADRVISIDPATGAATVKGAPISPRLVGTTFGVDFNPVPDRIRVVSDQEQNLRLHPDNGGASAVTAPSTTGDGNLAYASGDAGAGSDPAVSAAGYTNSFAGTTATTLYDVDTARDVLVTQAPPNNGTLNTVGPLGVEVTNGGDLDITPAGGAAFGAFTPAGGVATLYRVNLETGALTSLGALAPSTVEDLSLASPGRLTIAAITSPVAESSGQATVTVARTGASSGTVTVDYATANGSATAGSDYTATTGTLTFADGETTKTFTVPLTADSTPEADETFTVTLSNPGGGAGLGATPSRTVTITDGAMGPASTAYALTTANEIVTFSLSTPGTPESTKAITGLQTGEDVVGIDVRPATGVVYAVGSASRIYTVDPATGAATFVAALSTPLSGTVFGVDFNPVPDRLRIVSDTEQNLRVNVDTGAVLVDGPLTPGNDIVGAGYTNSFAGTTTTTLYDVDAAGDRLVKQDPPNNGTIVPVGPLGVDITNGGDLDITPSDGSAYGAFTPVGGAATLYRIDLGTGALTTLGAFGPATVEDLTIASPGRVTIAASTSPVSESASTATVTVGRTAGTNGTVTVDYATSDGTATAGSDYTATSGTLTFAAGETTKTFSVPLAADSANEPDESFTVTLSNPRGGAGLGATPSQAIVITDDDGAETTLSLATAGPRAARGAPARLSGVLTGPDGPIAGAKVELVARNQNTTRSAVVRTYTTAADGSYGGEVFPTVNTVLFTQFAGDTAGDLAAAQSPSILQAVRTSINAKAALNELDGPVAVARISGDTAPAKPGTIVRLQLLKNGQLYNFDAAARVDRNGRWALQRRLAKGTYVLRVAVQKTHSNEAGLSNELVVRVS